MADGLVSRTVAVTGSPATAPELELALASAGARVVRTPLVAIVDPPDWAPCDQALDRLADYDWLVLTSRTTWQRLALRLASRGRNTASCVEQAPKVAAIGPGTADAARDAGFRVALVAEDARSEGLVDALRSEERAGLRVLLPRALDARDVLPNALAAAGAHVDAVACYAVEPDLAGARALRDALDRLHAITIASGSAGRALVDALGGAQAAREALAAKCVASIGPVTSRALEAAGMVPTIEARTPSADGLVSALIRYFGREEPAR